MDISKLPKNVLVNIISNYLNYLSLLQLDISISGKLREYLMNIYNYCKRDLKLNLSNCNNIIKINFYLNRSIKIENIDFHHSNISTYKFKLFNSLKVIKAEHYLNNLSNINFKNVTSISYYKYSDDLKLSTDILEIKICCTLTETELFDMQKFNNLISLDIKITRSNENMLFNLIGNNNNLKNLKITYNQQELEYIRKKSSKILRFIAEDSQCPSLENMEIVNSFVEVDNTKDMIELLNKISNKHFRLKSLNLIFVSFVNFNETSICTYSGLSATGVLDFRSLQSYNFRSQSVLNYKIEGNVQILIDFINFFSELKHFGISYLPSRYNMQLIRKTNLTSLKNGIAFFDNVTLNSLRN